MRTSIRIMRTSIRALNRNRDPVTNGNDIDGVDFILASGKSSAVLVS